MIDCIHFYRVSSLEAAHQFYSEVMSFPLYKDQGKCLIFDTGHGKIGFCTHFPKEASSHACITFVYDSQESVMAQYERLVSLGFDPTKPDFNDYFGIYHFFLNDPNDIKLEFQYFYK